MNREEEKASISSGEYWYSRVIHSLYPTKEGINLEKGIISALKHEIPSLCSVTLERKCNLACTHCIYQPESSSKHYSERFGLARILEHIIRQMPTKEKSPRQEAPMLLHEGRTLRKWHLELLAKMRRIRPDARIGLIDNGGYTRLLEQFKDHGVQLDTLDISVDGLEKAHNAQRDPVHCASFKEAAQGLLCAKDVVIPGEYGGRVSALFTLTSVNYLDIEKTADFLFESMAGYVDQFHVATMTLAREINFSIEISLPELREAWKQIKNVYAKYGNEKIVFKLYHHGDMEKLATVVGSEKVREALLPDNIVGIGIGGLTFEIDGAEITYFPLSIWPQETFLIDADGVLRVAHSLKYTLEELRSGKGEDGSDTTLYTVKQLTAASSFVESYKEVVDHWWKNLGKNFLEKEIQIFKAIREGKI